MSLALKLFDMPSPVALGVDEKHQALSGTPATSVKKNNPNSTFITPLTTFARIGHKTVRFADEESTDFSTYTVTNSTNISSFENSVFDISPNHMIRNPTMSCEGFSTDKCESRIVELKNVDHALFKEQLATFAESKQIIRVLVKETSPGNRATIWLYFDDLRDANFAQMDWPEHLADSSSRYVTVREYAATAMPGHAQHSEHGNLANLAQYVLTGEWTGCDEGRSVGKVIDVCIELAKSFGEIRNFIVTDATKRSSAAVRVEYFKLSDSQKLTNSAGLGHECGRP